MDDIEIPKDPEARIVAIFTHLSYIKGHLEDLDKSKAPMWAATAWKAVFYGVGTILMAAVLALIIIKPSYAMYVINAVF